ncbi:IcmT/TraK family protein [Halomonas elongata]|uniref:IcmT/TraK family protein n=1 Tax=Halomonas elongata TaxID=2746 RepID=UPI00255A7C08|nr:IcmT/TraK family protein [Halomonas elongata]MDL4860742.1 IcmT/TraK family protein [Halomonas elongata]
MASKWRHTPETLKFLGIPVAAYLPIFVVLYFPSKIMLALTVMVIMFFGLLNAKGLTLKVLTAKAMHWMRGRTGYARPWWYRKRMQNDE